jgi:hypothetical protein
MKAVRSSETFVNFYQTTLRHIREDSAIHTHHCKKLKYNTTTNSSA